MIETDVHNINIAYDDFNIHTNHFIAYLKFEGMREKMHEYCDLARKSFDYGVVIKDNKGYEYNLKYVGDDKFTLILKTK